MIFKVLDAKRVGKKGMREMMRSENIAKYIKKYALYKIELK